MKKTFIAGVLLLAMTVVGGSTFTSCKDNNEADFIENKADYAYLKQALDDLQQQLINCKGDCQQNIADLLAKITKLQSDKADKTELTAAIEALKNVYVTQAAYDAAMKTVNDRLKALEEKEDKADQFTASEVADLKAIIALKAQIEKIAGLESSVQALEKWFELGKYEGGFPEGFTPAEFQKYVMQGQWVIDNKTGLEAVLEKLEEIKLLDKDAIVDLNTYHADFSKISEMYDILFPEGTEGEWWSYAEVIENIKANTKAIADLQEKLLDRLNNMVTSLVLQATTNPVFGGFNSPLGVNSMVLMTYYGENTTGITAFPSSEVEDCNLSFDDNDIDWAALTSDSYSVGEQVVGTNDEGQAVLGNLWFTVNPGTVENLDGEFALVNSRDDDPVVALNNVTKDDETVLKFGISSRAAGNGNGLYQADVTVDPAQLGAIKVHIQPGLANTLKEAVKNHTASDMVAMFKAIYKQLQDVCDANALRYTYDAYTSQNEDGSWNKTQQKVYSNYGVAATAFKPLSFATLKGSSLNVKLPTISPISINKDLVNLNLGTFTVDSKNFSLNIKFGEPTFNHIGEMLVPVELTTEKGDKVTGTINIAKDANDIVDSIKGSIQEWLKGNGTEENPGLDAKVDKSIWVALFNDPNAVDPKYPYDPEQPIGVVTDLIAQVNDMTGNIQDKLNNLVDQINNDYLGRVNSLVDRYNTVAERINNMLKDPNHYLQVTMLYRKAGKFALNGTHMPEVELPFGLLSTNPSQPTQFKGVGEAISLWATTYNFETVCPTFKKMVAVTKVTTPEGENTTLRDKANATLAKVLPGDRNRVALNVAGAPNGTVYEIAYQALDYSGFTSTVKCYVQVIR